MARYTVYPSRMGYQFEYSTESSRGSGWRPTREWAKKTARARAEAAAAADDGVDAPRSAPTVTDPPAAAWVEGRRGPPWTLWVLILALIAMGTGGYLFVSDRRADIAAAETEITVLTIPRLSPAVTRIGKAFEQANPGKRVKVATVAVTELADKTVATGPDYVIGEASVVDKLQPREITTSVPGAFGFDVLQLVVLGGNPSAITSLDDLVANPALTLGLCEPSHPSGSAAARALKKAGIDAARATKLPNPAGVVQALTGGRLQAALLLRLDVSSAAGAAGTVDAIALPQAIDERVDYHITLRRTGRLASDFRTFLDNSSETTAILKQSGLLEP